jgi:hypothetical protein
MMSKYCAKCGTELEESSGFCFGCGAHISEENPALSEPPAAPVSQIVIPREEPDMPPPDQGTTLPPKQPKNRKKLWLILLAAAAVLTAVVLWLALDKGYERALKNYVATMNGDLDRVEQLAPQEYWEYLAEKNKITVADAIKQKKESIQTNCKAHAETHGKNAHFTAKCIYAEPVDAEILQKIKDYMEKEFGIRPGEVKDCVVMDVYMRWEGNIRDSSYMNGYCAVRIGFRWYLGYYYNSRDEILFSFVAG